MMLRKRRKEGTVAKLNQLVLLENMLETYDAMNLKDANITSFQGVCTENLVDEINSKLRKLLVSKTRLTARNVLLANYKTMTQPAYWLKSKLFKDLPQATGKMLREKVEQMVELLNELMLKIVNVDDEYAATFFKKLRTAYGKRRISKYELWKAQLPEVTKERLLEYQVQLTADMLMMGVLQYDQIPTDGELEKVDLEKIQQKLRYGMEVPQWFKAECAKLRRYSHWENERFVIDYQKLRKYMFQHFGELTQEQRIALFEYDVQLAMIHKEMERLTPEKGRNQEDTVPEPLRSEKATWYKQKLVKAGIIDSNWQPINLSRADKGELAMQLATKLDISNVWQVFGKLWNFSPEQLRTAYNNGCAQKKSEKRRKKYKEILN